MLKIGNDLLKSLNSLVNFNILDAMWVSKIQRHEQFTSYLEESSSISVNLLVVWVSGEVASPVQATVVIPNWENVVVSGFDWFF